MEYPFTYPFHPDTSHTPTLPSLPTQHDQADASHGAEQPYHNHPAHQPTPPPHPPHQHFSPAQTAIMDHLPQHHHPHHHPHQHHHHPSLGPYAPFPSTTTSDPSALPFPHVDFSYFYDPRSSLTDPTQPPPHPFVPTTTTTTATSALPSPLPTPVPEDETASNGQTPFADLPGKTNWEPAAFPSTHPTLSDPPPPPPRTTSRRNARTSARQAKSTFPSRSKRAAASKARSNIASYATQMRSPPASASLTHTASIDSRPVSRATSISGGGRGGHSRASSRASFHPSESASIASYHPPPPGIHAHPTDPPIAIANSVLRVPINSEPVRGRKSATQHITLKNHRGYLLPVEPGAILEVNDLLILQPPSLSPVDDGPHAPRNQYTGAAPCPEEYKSMYEMYTCRVCSKTYDGKNARSVARRHLQDKHGVPLAMQKRRTRWDGELDRPKSDAEALDRAKRAKRDWAQKRRLLTRLERVHVAFLEQYGPHGITAPTKTHLIAPTMRDKLELLNTNQYPPGDIGWADMPKHLREGIAEIEGIALPFTLDEAPPNQLAGPNPIPSLPSLQKVRNDRRSKNASISTTFSTPSSTSDLSVGTQRGAGELQTLSPGRFAHSAPEFGLRRTPTANSRDALAPSETMPPSRGDWTSWGAASYVSDAALRAVMAHHYANMPPNAEDTIASDFAVQATLAAESGSEESARPSPDPLVSIDEIAADLRQGWAVDDPVWYSLAAQSDTPGPTYGFPTPLELKNWISQEPSPIRNQMTGGETNAEGEVEAVAAESLLNLHSTPARPEESCSGSSRSQPTEPTDGGSPKQSTQKSSSELRPLSSAPEATPGPTRPVRAKSLVQPFAKGRQDALARSLSLTQTLDDPFAFTPSNALSLSTSNRKKRRSTIASPSPLALKRKKEKDGARGEAKWPRAALSSIHPNTEGNRGTPLRGYDPQIQVPSSAIVSAGSSNVPSSGISGLSSFTLLGAPFVTPVKPQRGQNDSLEVCRTASKPWQFSSPGDGGMAASLGLVPQWGGVSGTPGVSGIEAGETPGRG